MRTGKTGVLIVVTIAAITSLLLMTGCIRVVTSGKGIVGSPDLETREFDFSDFTNIEVGYAFEVDITRADTYSVYITLNENMFEYLDISRSGKTLRIRMKSSYIYEHVTRQASITLPALRSLHLSGASRGGVTGFETTDDMRFDVSGASNLSLVDLKAGDTSFDISGASRVNGSIEITEGDFGISGASTVELEGKGTDVRLEVSGASTARLERFPVEIADTHISGASNVTIEVSDRLDIDVSGASRLYYNGGAELGRVNVSGASTLNRR